MLNSISLAGAPQATAPCKPQLSPTFCFSGSKPFGQLVFVYELIRKKRFEWTGLKWDCTKSWWSVTHTNLSSTNSAIKSVCSPMKPRYLEILQQQKMTLLTRGHQEALISRELPSLSGRAALQPYRWRQEAKGFLLGRQMKVWMGEGGNLQTWSEECRPSPESSWIT